MPTSRVFQSLAARKANVRLPALFIIRDWSLKCCHLARSFFGVPGGGGVGERATKFGISVAQKL